MEAREARQQLVQHVKDDIRQVLSHSWELQQVLKAAPKANPATLQRLSRPKNTRARNIGDACLYADWSSTQLSKQRELREQQEREDAKYEAARQEALQGWLRAREQEQRQAAILYQQQLQEQQEQARASASRVTQLAIADLEALKQQLEQQKQQAAWVGEQAVSKCGARAALRQRWPGMVGHQASEVDYTTGFQQTPACQEVQPVLSYIRGYITR